MDKWEYRYLEITYDVEGQVVSREDEEEFKLKDRPRMRPYLDLLGAKGWEVVSVLGQSRPSTVLLKRKN